MTNIFRVLLDLRLWNLSFPALVTPENNRSYQKLFPSLVKWQMNEVKYYLSKLEIEQFFIFKILTKPFNKWRDVGTHFQNNKK